MKKVPASAAPVERPLVETNGALAIQLVESQVAKLVALDPSNRDAVADAERYLYGDVKRVFGAESEELIPIWQNSMLPDDHLLGSDEDDFDPSAWHAADKIAKRKAAIDRMIARVRRLVDRARDLVALHGSMKRSTMGLEDLVETLGTEFTLVKQVSGDRASYKGVRNTGRGTLQVHDPHFAGDTGDTIEFQQPNGKAEVCDVMSVSHEGAQIDPELAYYTVKLRHVSARPVPPPPSVVHDHSTHVTMHNSAAGAIGANATVASSQVTGQAIQWNGVDRDQLAAELAKLKAALIAQSDDEDAEIDRGHVAAATKALKAGDEHGFVAAMKLIGAKAWSLVDKLALPVTMALLQAHGYVLPAPHGG